MVVFFRRLILLIIIGGGTNTPNWNKLTHGKITHDTYGILNLTSTNKTIELNFNKKGTNNILPISRDITLAIRD